MKKSDFIIQDLLSKIYQQQFRSGKLPTQRELARSYGVSRDTVQRAVSALADMGVVRLVQGSGIYLSHLAHVNPLVFNSLTRTSYDRIVSRCLDLSCGPATQDERHVFQMPGPLPVWRIKRLRIVNHVREQIEVTHMPTTLFPDLTRAVVEHSIQDYVERKGYRISHFMTTYTPCALTRDEAELLACKRSTPAMQIQSRGILSTGRVYEFSRVVAIDYSVSYISPFDREGHRGRMGRRD